MRCPIRLCLLALGVALGLSRPAAAGDIDPDAGPVVVTLRASAAVTESPVCVGHVATLSGGTAELRRRIAGLDLADRPARGKALSLLRDLVTYRIQVAGIGRICFSVQGAPLVQVTTAAALTDDDFLEAARDALRSRFPARPEDVLVSLAQLSGVPQLNLGPKDDLRLQAEAREPINVPGRCRVEVTLLLNGERLAVVTVVVDVKLYQAVAVAARPVDGGQVLSEQNVRIERRAIDAFGSYVTPKDLQAGRKARWALAAGQVIPATAVKALNADSPVLVKQRDLVKLVATVGSLRVSALGEAEQDGRDGDRVRVRNVDSKKELVGRVIGRGLVEVDY